MSPDPELMDRLKRHGQEHLLGWWDQLDDAGRARLAAEVAAIDLEQLDRLVKELVAGDAAAQVEPSRVDPIDVVRLPRTDGERIARRRAAEHGAEALAAGEVGVILVAGGSGTRLGYDGPKGTFPIGPVSQASLFQIHAEKIVALGRRHGRALPLYVMTSPENNDATRDFFEEHGNFGLGHVRFFVQGQMPAVDKGSGKVLLAEPGHVALSPDGHGGTLAALAAPGPGGSPSCLDEMREKGVRTLFYFQVDNPLVQIADPGFLGLHRQADAEMSFKVIEKLAPDEKVGVVVAVDGVPQVIEYSDLPPELANRRVPEGSLELWAGSIAIHVLERSFIERLVGEARLPFHRAIKKVPYVDASGALVKPGEPNAVKFEQFIFDALPMAKRWAIVETDRPTEFEPLKNAVGPDSPATVHQRMSDLFGSWLEQAGATVPRRADGSVPFGIEISPLYALDAQELRSKLEPGFVVQKPVYLR
ncbi:putative uridylyltransferase [Aquisphaera giovannonii]|uniref:Putative uridylyltransferase n=1 Tax=Aquisphaera giovannonii TaxID=406548 RepID=A0A5B9VXU2_9BACT|nr:UTP--glucose-1-phosphate uridylyltransferase [Aquisphaera giovannonii]QEH32711.1 putative uridylyltransferase [Aquisphaera giovannonii]